MGKQVEFFMTKLDELEFLKCVWENDYLIMDDKASVITLEKANELNLLSLFITFQSANICKSKNGFLDVIISETIQFSRSLNRSDYSMSSGRLWAEFKYYNLAHELSTKTKEMSDMYNILVKWIKKNMKKSKCKDFYIGNDAYRLCKMEEYRMVAGPKHIVEFE